MNRQVGFTVIEVLIASFILFLVISSASLIFSNTVKSKQAATESLLLYGYVPVLMDHIHIQLQEANPKRTDTGYLLGVNYKWDARISASKPVESRQDGSLSSGYEALLWDVSLVVSTERKSEIFNFSVTSWR